VAVTGREPNGKPGLKIRINMKTKMNLLITLALANVPPILTEKHKVLQILVNLIRNMMKRAAGIA
jgi:nitrogen-specific signal transduction histidine kinase